MTTHDQDAEVGRLMREQRDLRHTRAALLAKGRKIGELFASMGNVLTIQPPHGQYPMGHFQIDDRGVVNVAQQYQQGQIMSGEYPSVDEVRQFIDDLKRVDQQLKTVETSIKAFGL